MDYKKFIKDNWKLIAAIVYVLSPIDLIPEVLVPVVGYADDLLVLLAALLFRYAVARKDADVIEGEILEEDFDENKGNK